MTKEEILAIDPDFQWLIDMVLFHNKGITYEYWHDLWGRTIKPLNSELRVCGWEAKHEGLMSSDAYSSMVSILEELSNMK